MPRRFLTAEDVRRATTNELVVDEDTLVTPQALETAEASGVTIRGGTRAGSGAPPSRGPDAERAVYHLPHLPEPASESESGSVSSVMVTAVGRNRPGVLAELTKAIGHTGGSVHDISQRVVEGFFHLVMVVEFDDTTDFHTLATELQCLGGPDDYAVRVMHERVFRFMHRV